MSNPNPLSPPVKAASPFHLLFILIPLVLLLLLAFIFLGPSPQKLQMSPLQNAAYTGDLPALKNLLAQGANINAQSHFRNWAPLHAAADSGQLPTAEFLITSGALIDPIDNELSTPLHLTAYSETGKPHPKSSEPARNAIAVLLLQRGANPNRPNTHGDTPLHSAVIANNLPLVKTLLAAGADPSVRNNQSLSPANIASSLLGPSHEITQLLTSHPNPRSP